MLIHALASRWTVLCLAAVITMAVLPARAEIYCTEWEEDDEGEEYCVCWADDIALREWCE
jgi:hypothetical protein